MFSQGFLRALAHSSRTNTTHLLAASQGPRPIGRWCWAAKLKKRVQMFNTSLPGQLPSLLGRLTPHLASRLLPTTPGQPPLPSAWQAGRPPNVGPFGHLSRLTRRPLSDGPVGHLSPLVGRISPTPGQPPADNCGRAKPSLDRPETGKPCAGPYPDVSAARFSILSANHFLSEHICIRPVLRS